MRVEGFGLRCRDCFRALGQFQSRVRSRSRTNKKQSTINLAAFSHEYDTLGFRA